MNTPVKPTSFLLAADTHQRIRDYAHDNNVSMSALLNDALAKAFPAPAAANVATELGRRVAAIR